MKKKQPGPEPSGKSETILARVSPQTRRMIEESAARFDRSISREIEARLSASFDDAAETSMDDFGTPHTGALMMLVATAVTRVEEITGERWYRDRFTFEEAVIAAAEVMGRFKPEGSRKPPATFPEFRNMPDDLRRDVGARLRKQGLGKTCAAQTVAVMDYVPESDSAGRKDLARSFPAAVKAWRLLRSHLTGSPIDLAETQIHG